MAAFPSTLEASPKSRIKPNSGLKVYATEGGGIKGRQQYAQTVYKIDLIFEYLTDAEVTSIMDHYNGGPAVEHTVAIRGVTFNVYYSNEPQVAAYNGTLQTLKVSFLGLKA